MGERGGKTHTANDPGAFLAAVQPQPLYRPNPSSLMIFRMPRPRKASGFVCRLILRTSRGNRMISPMPMRLANPLCQHSLYSLANFNHGQIWQISPSRGRVHNSLARFLAKRILKVLAVVLAQEVARHGLAAVLVYPLQHLVAGRVPEAGEERDELLADGRGGLVLEDDRVELREAGDLFIFFPRARSACFSSSPFAAFNLPRGPFPPFPRGNVRTPTHLRLIAHQPLRNGIDLSCRQTPVSPGTVPRSH